MDILGLRPSLFSRQVDGAECDYRGREALLSGTRRSLLQALLDGSFCLWNRQGFICVCLEEFIKLRSSSSTQTSLIER